MERRCVVGAFGMLVGMGPPTATINRALVSGRYRTKAGAMSRRLRASELADPRSRQNNMCLCTGCRPTRGALNGTFVCFACRRSKRDNYRRADVRCNECGSQMEMISVRYSAALPRRSSRRGWRLLRRALRRPLAPKVRPFFEDSPRQARRKQGRRAKRRRER